MNANYTGMNGAVTPSAQAGDSDIANRISKIISKDSPLVRQARTQGLQQANRRGVANSSMGIGAGFDSVVRTAAPIAGQDAAIAAGDRQTQLAAITNQLGNYQSALGNTLNNHEIPAAARSDVQRSLRDQLNYGLDWMQNLYGVSVPGGRGAPAPAPAQPQYGIGGGFAYPGINLR